MKTRNWQKLLATAAVTGLAWSASTVLAQDSSATTAAQPAALSAPVPQLSYGVAEIVKLEQAKVGDDTIIAYINSSGNSYGLNAGQIIYLKQQGVSEAVITAMLNQPRSGTVAAAPSTPASQPAASSTITTTSGSTATVAPTVTYVQTAPAAAYYYQPYYYPAYAWYPPVVFSFGWHGGWRR